MMQGPFDDQTLAQDSTAPEATNWSAVSTTYPHVSSFVAPRLYVSQYNHFSPSDLPLPPYHSGSNIPPTMHTSYFSVENESLDHSGAFLFFHSSDVYNPSGSFHSPPDPLPSPFYGRSPPHPTPYPHLPRPQPSWTAESTQAGSVDEYYRVARHYSPSPPPQNLGNSLQAPTLEPYSGTLGASYPCRWTENGIDCDVMVQATRSHMNRHLHTDHGFTGSDARQTRCRWAGCGETMQQGSVARHLVTCHLQAKVTCPACFKKLSRQDVISKHQRVCPASGAYALLGSPTS